ncbi:MAG: hypothetical protein ACLTKT_04885 [Clostridia bacterium]|nr:hypothetical protein [Clostridium sp.]
MEPQEKIYCYDNREEKCNKKRNCLYIVATILLAAFTLVIGIIIGIALASRIFVALPSIIVLAIVLGLLLILTLILLVCCRKKEKKCKCCCN